MRKLQLLENLERPARVSGDAGTANIEFWEKRKDMCLSHVLVIEQQISNPSSQDQFHEINEHSLEQ